ncbi:hypothetical protein TL16_g12581 [Triparma laevis f. inornata]|uniref:Uncharacterized protein n=1 Tax=Triparma laevis f. inornata TaxID=1714386 RepID=A0A9W7BT49_9STRA|nr:hypothetical protein TL16_g12581 [Triparma laevis f. inornata]
MNTNEKVSLPLWTLAFLCFDSRFFDVTLPKHFSDSFRKKLDAGGDNFNLRLKSTYFYSAGNLLCSAVKAAPSSRRSNDSRLTLLKKECEILREVLKKTFVGERLRRTLDWCLSCRDEDVSEFTSKLTVEEKNLFDIGARASLGYHEWKHNGSRKIQVSSIIKQSNARRVVSPEEKGMNKENPPSAFSSNKQKGNFEENEESNKRSRIMPR